MILRRSLNLESANLQERKVMLLFFTSPLLYPKKGDNGTEFKIQKRKLRNWKFNPAMKSRFHHISAVV